jgi:hypothetical protein
MGDRTHWESIRHDTLSASYASFGERRQVPQLIYIGSPENAFADAGRTFVLDGQAQVHFRRGNDGFLRVDKTGDELKISVPLSWVSSRHAKLRVSGDGKRCDVQLEDLGSRNGTFIEGHRLDGETSLRPGRIFEIGRSFWCYQWVLEGAQHEPVQLDDTGTANPQLSRIHRNLNRLAPGNVPVLLVGETGVGKRHLGRALHHASGRDGEFVHVDLGEVPISELLLGSAGKDGLLRRARGGTLFVESIDRLENDGQKKLAMLVDSADEDGGAAEHVRLITGCRRDPRSLVSSHRLRSDLYSLIGQYEARLPPLRERREDLGLLIRRFAQDPEGLELRIDTAAFRQALRHAWPGNVTELEHALTSAADLSTESMVTLETLEMALEENATVYIVEPEHEKDEEPGHVTFHDLELGEDVDGR